MQPFPRIKVWQKAHELSIALHRARFRRPRGGGAPGFRPQLLRAVNAIADNIAEGAGQRSRRQFVRFLEIALASAHEVDSQLERAIALGVFDPVKGRALQERTWEVKRMLTAFHRTVKRCADEEDEGPRARFRGSVAAKRLPPTANSHNLAICQPPFRLRCAHSWP